MTDYNIFFNDLEYDYLKIIKFLEQYKSDEKKLIEEAKKLINVKENIISEIKLISDICKVSNNEAIKYAILLASIENVFDLIKNNYSNKDINKLIQLLLYIENYVYSEFENTHYIDNLLEKVYDISNRLQKIISK
ncbi:hypothetical protein SAMN02745164_01508 [Marinitoga hydrogenitolerans DSM 16785]|uniref:Uncharacterized protein n=1 Tax=Marinitoga hydrogenitolerans (strain DSM 16785 / JCM 12826 / AT1271) TaxID=1122195 RepID=A0A1M4XSG8_MARH1|nr:hypothetical protein [Marinitoga hydrogenitolerans]SHE96411.1 hypothetical protein SAMN02745164_01508 [Marinitoga hydrogenitolerans DSM 16785]